MSKPKEKTKEPEARIVRDLVTHTGWHNVYVECPHCKNIIYLEYWGREWHYCMECKKGFWVEIKSKN